MFTVSLDRQWYISVRSRSVALCRIFNSGVIRHRKWNPRKWNGLILDERRKNGQKKVVASRRFILLRDAKTAKCITAFDILLTVRKENTLNWRSKHTTESNSSSSSLVSIVMDTQLHIFLYDVKISILILQMFRSWLGTAFSFYNLYGCQSMLLLRIYCNKRLRVVVYTKYSRYLFWSTFMLATENVRSFALV